MAEESVDSGLSSEQSQASKEKHHCYPSTLSQQQNIEYLQSQPEGLLDPQKYPLNQISRYYARKRTPTGEKRDGEDTEDTVAERPPDVLTNKPLADLYSRMSGDNGNFRTGYNAPRDRQRFPIPPQQVQIQQQSVMSQAVQQHQSHHQQQQQQQQQQQTPRVHFGLGNRSEPPFRRGPPMGHLSTPLSRNVPENALSDTSGTSSAGGNYRPRPPFVRSLSSKAFELASDTSPSTVKSPRRFRASSPPLHRWPPELEGKANLFQAMHQLERTFPDVLDKGIQCERDSSIQGSPKTTTRLPMSQTTSAARGFVPQHPQSPPPPSQTNPLLSALLAAAANATMNLSEQPPGGVTARRALRPQSHGSLPYWSDTEISPYDTLEALTSTAQPGAAKAYQPVAAASAVAAAAAAAAAAMAAVQSTTSRVPRPGPVIAPLPGVPMTSAKSLEGVYPSPISRAALQLSNLPLEDYNCLPTAEMDPRQSVLRSNVAGQRPESGVYGRTGFVDSNAPTRRPSNIDLVTMELPANAGQRFPIQENISASAGDTGIVPVPGGPIENQELTRSPSSPFTQARRTDTTANIIASQFNLLSSEPYPLSSEHPLSPQSPRPGVCQDAPDQARFRQKGATEKRTHSHTSSTEETAGLLVVNVIAGSGLKTSQMLLRDLYCVLETDSVRKARSMIRTNTDFFEWDEVFEIEIEETRFLSLLVYQWDPRTRHRLCFYGGIDLRSFIRQRRQLLAMNSESEFNQQQAGESENKPLTSPIVASSAIRFEKIALQLEPKGIMYLQLGILPLKSLYIRRNFTNSYEAGLFGVSLDELMYRNRLLTDLLPPPPNDTLSHAVPLLIRKCVEEVDRRGTDVVGIYRLSGSVWMKLQVRELLSRTADKIIQGISKQNEKAVKVALATLDLSADSVPDIHAITATLKDFFRELPEPLFTNALYPMVYEATQVAGPGDSHMGTKLILNILDCLPTSNQEVLLYLLDHLKRITSKSMVNKMNSHNLAVCLAPVLLHPSPEAAKEMEPSLIESRKMVSILECILDIWP